MRPALPASLLPDPPPSRASPLPQEPQVSARWVAHHRTLWEPACWRWGQHCRHLCCLTHRHRGQARSHRNRRCLQNRQTSPKPVGAGLPAMRPALPASLLPDPPPSRASPLPQEPQVSARWVAHHRTLWEPACWRWGQHCRHLCCLTHRHRGQARSHRNRRCLQNRQTSPKPVGAGLPAMRPALPASLLPDPPPSRASPLPQEPQVSARWVAHR